MATVSPPGDEGDELQRLKEQLRKTVETLQLRTKQNQRLAEAKSKLQEELDAKTAQLGQVSVSKKRHRAPQRQKLQAKVDELTREVRAGWIRVARIS